MLTGPDNDAGPDSYWYGTEPTTLGCSGPDAGPELRHLVLQGGFGPYVRHPVYPPHARSRDFLDEMCAPVLRTCDIPLVAVAKRVSGGTEHAQVGICEHGYLAYGGPRALFWDALRFAHGDPGTGTDPDTHSWPLDAPGVDCAGEMEVA